MDIIEERTVDEAKVDRRQCQILEAQHVLLGAVDLDRNHQHQIFDADAAFARLVEAGFVRQDHAGKQRLVAAAIGRDALRPLVHAEVGTDAVAGAMRVVEAGLPQELPRQRVELRAACPRRKHGAGERDPDWGFIAIDVWSRVWLATRVSRRTWRATTLFVRKLQETLRAVPQQLLVTSDCFKYYPPVLKRVLGPLCVYVQLDNHYRRDRLLSSSPRLVLGSPAELERALARSEDSNKPNTAFIERLNIYLRRAISYLQRRTTGKVRRAARLENALEIVRLYYNFIRPHSSLRFGRVTRTPAMQAGLFDRPLTFRGIFSWVPPPPVVRPRHVEYR